MSSLLHITIADFDCMIAAGMFDPPNDRRVELIEGELREMSPVGNEHAEIVDLLNHWSFEVIATGKKFRVRCQQPLGIPELESVPYPDLAWVKEQNYREQKPTPDDVLLLIEVAQSSLRYDRGAKARLYAAAGIQDYWIVNVAAEQIEVHRQPTTTGYAETTVIEIGKKAKPLAFPKAALDVKKLFA